MWAIVKADLAYNYKRISLNALILMIFSLTVLNNVEEIGDGSTYSKAFWPMAVAFGTVLIVLFSYKISMKEERSRLLLLLPVELKKIAVARLIAGAIQLSAAYIYLLVIHRVLMYEWIPVTDRIFYQLGSYTFMMSAILFIYYTIRTIKIGSMPVKVALGILMFISVQYLIYLVDMLIFNSVPHYLLGLIYFSAGMILYFSSNQFFQKQKSFLEKVLVPNK